MKTLNSFFVLFLFAFSLFAQNTVVDIIVNSPDHTTLEAAVIAAELDDDLSGDGPFTVFAPTDAAFAALPAGTVTDLLMDPTGELANILLYHVLGAQVLSTDLSDGQVATTLLGDDITVSITGGNVFINDAQVTVADIMADNGVVHVIDAVLLPNLLNTNELTKLDATIFPNPSTDFVSITLPEEMANQEVTISLIDLTGKILTEQIVNQRITNLNTKNFPSGTYFIKATSSTVFSTNLFVIR